MKSIRNVFRSIGKYYYWIIPITIVLSSVILISQIEEQCLKVLPGRIHTWHDHFILFLQITKGQLSEIRGPEVGTAFQVAKVLLPVCLAWGVIEIVIRSFIRFFARVAVRRFHNRHVVVFGIGEKGLALVRELCKNHIVVAVDKNADNSKLEQIERLGGLTLVGDATEVEFLKTLGLHRAAAFYAMTGDDTINIKCALSVKKYFKGRARSFWYKFWGTLLGYENKPFTAWIQVHDSVLRRLAWEENGPFSHASLNENARTAWVCYPLSVYDQAAKRIVEKFPPDHAWGETQQYHVAVIGFGWFAERVTLQIIRMCQAAKILGKKIVIHVIDNQAELNRKRFYRRYPAVDPESGGDPRYGGYAPPAELDFIQGDIHLMNEKAVRDAVPEIDKCAVVYVCLADELLGTEAAMSLAGITRGSRTRIVLALPETERLSDEMKGAFENHRIEMFFPLKESCSLHPGETHLGEIIDKMGMVVDWAYDMRDGSVDYSTMDESEHIARLKKIRKDLTKDRWSELEKKWSELDEWKRESNRQFASHVFFKLRLAGIDTDRMATVREEEIVEKCMARLASLAEVEHDRWSVDHLLGGWTYGHGADGKKDSVKRFHPEIRPYAELDKGTKDIDYAISSTLPVIVDIWKNAVKCGD